MTIPAGTAIVLRDVDLVAGDCGATSCPLLVEGHLRMEGGKLAPATGSATGAPGTGLPIAVTGTFEGVGVTIQGLIAGIPALGGTVDLRDCELIDTGILGAASILGKLRIEGCVFAGQTLGVYGFASHVELRDNTFFRMGRSAMTLDESWGVVSGNDILHTKQAGIMVKGPLGATNLAIFGNWITETGAGISYALALEDRLLALDPLGKTLDIEDPFEPAVPVAARNRIQANWLEWNNIAALDMGPLSAPVAYGNEATHNNIGVRIGWLDDVRYERNNLYTGTLPWQSPQDRTYPRPDGNLWAGAWQIGGPHALMLDAPNAQNHWGPFMPPREACVGLLQSHPLPVDAMCLRSPVTDPRPGRQAVPMLAAVTAPGYGGGLVPALARDVDGVLQPFDPGTDTVPLVGLLNDLVVTEWVSRPTPVHVDLGKDPFGNVHLHDVTVVRLQGDVYSFAPEAMALLEAVTEPDGFQDVLAALTQLPIDRELVLSGPLARTVTLDVPIQNGTGSATFTFDGLKESRVEWRVAGLLRGDVSTQMAVVDDEHHYKDAVTYNSLLWPTVADLRFLVNDLLYGLLDVTSGDLLQVRQASLQGLPASGDLLAQGLPLPVPHALLPDGTLPLNGDPDLASLWRDQDPTMMYEVRYGLSTELGAPLSPLGQATSLDRTFALPELPEGVTLYLQARAIDASGLVSPAFGASMLVDLHPPTAGASGTCLSTVTGGSTGIRWWADEWNGLPGTPEQGYRTSGLHKLVFDLTSVHVGDDGLPLVQHREVIDLHGAQSASGTYALNTGNGLVNGAIYVAHVTALDRAGGPGQAVVPAVVVDLAAPRITMAADAVRLQQLDHLLSTDLTGLVYDAAGKLVGGTLTFAGKVSDVPTTALKGTCGLDYVRLQKRTEPNGSWSNIFTHKVDGAPEHSFSQALALGNGDYLELRVIAKDKAGYSSSWQSGNLIVDLVPPLPKLAARVPTDVCLNDLGSFLIDWGAYEVDVPAGGPNFQSGLARVKLVELTTGGSARVIGDSGDLAGPMAWDSPTPHQWQPLADGSFVFYVDAVDRAGNGRVWSLPNLGILTAAERALVPLAPVTVKVDRAAPSILPVGDLPVFHMLGPQTIGLEQVVAIGGHKLGIRATVEDPEKSCLLESVTVTLVAQDGTRHPVSARAGINARTASVDHQIDLRLAFPDLDGKRFHVEIVARDTAGNERTLTSELVLADLQPPQPIIDPPLPTCLVENLLPVAWRYANEAGDVTAHWEAVVGATRTTVGPSGSAYDASAIGTSTLGVWIHAVDAAGNKFHGHLGSVARDVSVPTWTQLPKLQLVPGTSGQNLFQLTFQATDVGCGLDHVRVDVYVDGVLHETRTLAGTVENVLNQWLPHQRITFVLTPVDKAGHQGAAQTLDALADFRLPTVSLSFPDIGKTKVKVLDTVREIGPGLGGTVLWFEPTATTPIPMTMTMSHPNPDIVFTPEVRVDGQLVALSGSGPTWTFDYALTGATGIRNTPHVIEYTVRGNTLSTSERHVVYLPGAGEATAHREEPPNTWTFSTNGGTAAYTAWSGELYSFQSGERGLKLVATGSQTSTATWDVDVPAARAVVDLYARVSKSTTGRMDIAKVLEPDGTTRAALYVSGTSSTLMIDPGTGGVSTGRAFSFNTWHNVKLVFSPSFVDVYLDGQFVRTYATGSATGFDKLVVGGTGGTLLVDDVMVRTAELGFDLPILRLDVGAAGEWLAFDGATLSEATVHGRNVVRMSPSSSGSYMKPATFSMPDQSTLVFNFQAPTTATQTLASIHADDGTLLLRLGLASNRLTYTTVENGATVTREATPALLGIWHRMEVRRVGGAFELDLDKVWRTTAVPLADRVPAEVRFGGSGLAAIQVDRLRVEVGDALRDRTFAVPLANDGWELYDPSGSGVTLDPTAQGAATPGVATLSGAASSKKFLAFPTAPLGSKFVVESTVRPQQVSSPPQHQAVVSGISGTQGNGDLVWAVTMGPGALANQWALYWWASGSDPTLLETKFYTTADWRTVRVELVSANTLAIYVNESPEPVATQTVNMAGVQRIAVGDISS
ncbi:MAG TPA: right-handed parallel beta-helix repeat-containing protein, partial [Candidatus Thermoplasmatota archaeon]|nr:right-handed parallel beta-helix repeat-containing protein [Candidatus Thermoplasmatota archaeon]